MTAATMPSDQALLREFYERYAHRVYARCRYLLRDDEEARDAMHDTFIKAQKNLDGFRGEASPLTWLTRIATNHCLNLIRSKKAKWRERYRQQELHAEKIEHASPSADGISFAEDSQLLRRVLDRVDKSLAEVAVYYFVDEMTQKEITELVGISTPTLRKRLREFVAIARDEIERRVPGASFQPAPL